MYLESEEKRPLILDPPTIFPKVEIPIVYIKLYRNLLKLLK